MEREHETRIDDRDLGAERRVTREPDGVVRITPGQRRAELLREISRIEAEIERLGRDAIEQGSLREPGEQGEFYAERARLEKRLDTLRRELNPPTEDDLTEQERAAIGRRVTIRLPEGEVETWELTAPSQANPRVERISVRSPLGRALIGKAPGDRTVVQTPEQSYDVEVLDAA